MAYASSTGAAGNVRTRWGVILLLALGFGLVGIDRFMISTMFPVIARDLKLDYRGIGVIVGALSIAWGLSALFMGQWADRLGRRRLLIGSMIAFSLLTGVSGLATGLIGLVVARVLMGLADGAYTPACLATTIGNAEPQHHGRGSGLQQMAGALLGLGLAPMMIASLLHVVDWRWIFASMALPGFAPSPPNPCRRR